MLKVLVKDKKIICEEHPWYSIKKKPLHGCYTCSVSFDEIQFRIRKTKRERGVTSVLGVRVCKVCGVEKGVRGVNTTCTDCEDLFYRADSEACNISGIRQDMKAYGVPLNGYEHEGKREREGG